MTRIAVFIFAMCGFITPAHADYNYQLNLWCDKSEEFADFLRNDVVYEDVRVHQIRKIYDESVYILRGIQSIIIDSNDISSLERRLERIYAEINSSRIQSQIGEITDLRVELGRTRRQIMRIIRSLEDDKEVAVMMRRARAADMLAEQIQKLHNMIESLRGGCPTP